MRSLAAVLALAFLLLPAGRALACTCVQQTPEEAFARATVVFEGRVVAAERVGAPDVGPARVRVTLRVTQAWKGVEHEQLTVWTSDSPATCGLTLEVGRAYLVYASGDAAQATTGLCSGTKRVEEAADEIAALGAGVVPVDVTDTPAPVAPRAHGGRGGCAGCAVAGAKAGGAPAALLVAAFGVMVVARRRTARRTRARSPRGRS